MNPDDLAKILDELGRRLGPAGEKVFELAVKQVYISGILGTIFSSILIILTLAILIVGLKYTQQHWNNAMETYKASKETYIRKPDRDGYALIWFPIGAIAGFIFLGAFATLYDSLIHLLNPEYAALKDILSTVSNIK